MRDDEQITPDDCRARAAHCLSAGEKTNNKRVRQLLQAMEKMWLKLATETERQAGIRAVPEESPPAPIAESSALAASPVISPEDKPMLRQAAPIARKVTSVVCSAAPAVEAQTMITSEKPKSRLLANAPQCSHCNTTMKVRTLRPGRKVDIVAYRCEECGEEVLVEVKRV
jgi:hypothetical protein